MSERGVVGMDRGVFEHELLKGEPYTRVQAWLWLVAEAAWKARRTRVAGVWIELERAQLAHSLGHMAKTWKWTIKRVRGFLARISADGMIRIGQHKGIAEGRSITFITICNYDEYQSVGLPKGTVEGMTGAREGQQPEEGKKDRERDTRARATSTISTEAFALSDRFLEAIKIDPQHPELYGMAGAPYAAQMWITRGYDHLLILAEAADLAARYGPDKPLKFYTACFETAHKKARTKQREMPLLQAVEGNHATTVELRRSSAPARDWKGRRDQWCVDLDEFSAGVDAAKSASGGSG